MVLFGFDPGQLATLKVQFVAEFRELLLFRLRDAADPENSVSILIHHPQKLVLVCGRQIQSRTFILLVAAEGKIITAKEIFTTPFLGKGSSGVKAASHRTHASWPAKISHLAICSCL